MNFCSKIIFFVVFFVVFFFCPKSGTDPCLAVGIEQKVKALTKMATTHSKKGNYTLALQMYDQAIQLQPSNLGLYYGRAFASGRSKNYLAAIRDFTRVIRTDKMNARKNKTSRKFGHAPRFRADCYMALGNMQKAAKDYIEFHGGFQNSKSKDGKVWSYLAEAFSLMGRNDLALKAIQKGLPTGRWTGRLRSLQQQILTGKRITPHKPLSN